MSNDRPNETFNPFISLVEEFRRAAANLDTRGFSFNAWWHLPGRFVDPKRSVLGLCYLSVRCGDEVSRGEFKLTVPTAGIHAKCGPVFADLASRAGAALPVTVRSELSDYVPLHVSQMAPWWFAFLWRVFVGPDPLSQPVWEDTGEPVELADCGFPLALPRPFLLSINAIELCRLHTVQPVFPPPDTDDTPDEIRIVEEKTLAAVQTQPTDQPKQGDEKGQADPTPEQPEDDFPVDREAVLRDLTPAVRRAYFAFQYAESKAGKRLQDHEAYKLLQDEGVPADKGDVGELTDYELPTFDTWSRQLREARRPLREQKYSPRGGRSRGRSVVKRDEI
jgi:hypothetical protein